MHQLSSKEAYLTRVFFITNNDYHLET